MPRSASGRMVRDTWIQNRKMAVSGTTTVLDAFSAIDGVPLDLFESLTLYWEVIFAATGVSPTLDLYVQRAIKPNASPGTAGDWEDYYHFPQVTTALTLSVVQMPAIKTGSGTQSGSTGYFRVVQALAVSTLNYGHWFDALRLVEVSAGTQTLQAMYNVHVVGRLEAGVDLKTAVAVGGGITLA